MPTVSPTLEGFRATFRRPSFTLGEIVWRWSVGASAIALFFFGLFEYLNTLPVSRMELLFLRTRQPYLVSQALARILRGSLSRVVMSALVAALLLALFWIIAGSLARIATVRALLEYFQADFARRAGRTELIPADGERTSRSPFRSLADLNFLRVSVAIGAAVGLIGVTILAGLVSSESDPRPGLSFLLWLTMGSFVCLVSWALNWFLSLAGLFAVRDGTSSMGAIAEAVSFCRERTGAVLAVSTWTALAHITIFVGATTIVGLPLGLTGLLPWRPVLLSILLLALIYCALADWLYMARLAGYVCIAEMPEALLAPPPTPVPPPTAAPEVATTIDRDELILSDAPGMIAQT